MGRFVKKLDLINHYHEFHDGNLPNDLLNIQEKSQLDKLLGDSANSLDSLRKLKSIDELNSPTNGAILILFSGGAGAFKAFNTEFRGVYERYDQHIV